MSSSRSEDSIQIDLRKDSKEGAKKRAYTAQEVDLVLVYIPQVDRVVAFGPEHFNEKCFIIVRLTPPKNGQQKGSKMAEDFIWLYRRSGSRWAARLGAERSGGFNSHTSDCDKCPRGDYTIRRS